MTVTAVDLGAVRRWLGILHGDSPGLIHVCSTGDWTGRTFTDLDSATGHVSYLDSLGREGIYARVTTLRTDKPRCTINHNREERDTCTRGWHGRGGVAETAALPALWADIDLAGPGHAEQDLPPDETAGRQIIATSGLPEPTLWIHSGGGLYPIWLLDQPWHLDETNIEAAQQLAKDWQRIIEHASASHGWRYGRGVGDLARVLRIPGTINRKAGLARPCSIISATTARYPVAQLQAALAEAVARISPPPAPTPTSGLIVSAPASDRPAGHTHPGEDFNTRADWPQILTPAGWRQHYSHDDVTYWTRPGKTTGISASTNALGTDRLHVFTTSAAPLDGGESYSKFGAYTALHFGGDHKRAARALGQQGYGTPLPDPATRQQEMIRDLLGENPQHDESSSSSTPFRDQTPGHGQQMTPTQVKTRIWSPEIDVSNNAVAADWLREQAGRGRLAGLFARGGQVMHTPREGEDGYQPIGGDDDNDGPAQVRPVGDSTLSSRITYTYGVYRLVKQGEDWAPKPALFPRSAARTALDVPDMLPWLRPLRGVIHSPICRPDGTLIEAPGYDTATGLLHLPEPGLTVPPVPERPTTAQVAAAVALLGEMLAGFPFVSPHHRANYVGALLTPLLRAVAPPPYKLHAIEAHQPGSGKTLLANLSRHIHGGVFRAEMPDDDSELRKQITAILSITTGPVIVLDNVSGALKSSTLAGLLTSSQWDDRPLGATAWTRAANDRLWTITGNNLAIGGDLPRRTIRTVIDPGRPNPEQRTEFAITDLETWVKAHRGDLLAALLTIVRAWVVEGMPTPVKRSSDGYAHWIHTVAGILACAGIKGTFDDASTQVEIGLDDDEWGIFLAAAHRAYGERAWTAKELLGDVHTGSLIEPKPIPADALPGDLEARILKPGTVPTSLAKSLTWWLRNREGRWAGGLTIRSAGVDSSHGKNRLWRIQANDHDLATTATTFGGDPKVATTATPSDGPSTGEIRSALLDSATTSTTSGTFQPTRAREFIDPLHTVTESQIGVSTDGGNGQKLSRLSQDLQSAAVA